MACKVPNAYRIGIDFDTLDYFELDIENVEEKYEAPRKHLDALKEGGEYYGEYSKEMIDYVEDKRIEINSVIAELDDNARFWGWIIEKLREHFPTRDYTRSVNIPEYVIPESLQLFNDKVKEKGIAIAKEQLDKLQENLSNISGFLFDRTNTVLQNGKQITIEKYDQILADHVRHIIESNQEIRKLLDKIDYLNYEEESDATEVKEV
ncbi:MAG: hypothetical protein WBQ25_26305 [Nitrososphaeraceae archaeon]